MRAALDPRTFLGLEPSHNPFRWKIDVRPEVCTSGQFLFGRAGLGALEDTSDFMPSGVSQALGLRGRSNSLDNTLRVFRLVPTQCRLLDIRVHGLERGFGHGLVHMFHEDGTLLATASQSCILRYRT